MKASRYVFLFVLSFIPILAAQVNDTYVIPAASNANGAFGTRWMTQFSVFNPQTYELVVSVTFLPSGGGHALEALIRVPSNSVKFADNALLEIFNTSGSGAFLVASFPEDNPTVPKNVVSRSFLVVTNTLNKLPNGGTFGQTIPGVWAGLQDYSTDGISAISHGLRNLSSFGWRTNFGGVNLGTSSVSLRIRIYDKNGNTLLKDVSYTIPGQAHMQWTLPVEIDQGSVEFFVDDPTKKAVVFTYTSTLDRYTGDPMYQSPTLLATANVLFRKGIIDPTTLGRKIDINMAREIRSNATPLGEVTLSSGSD
jgi:hypothetical protein